MYILFALVSRYFRFILLTSTTFNSLREIKFKKLFFI